MAKLNKLASVVIWSVVATAMASIAARHAAAQIEITEVMYNSLASGDKPWEWVEIRNTTGSAVDLHGWVFGDRASRYNFFNIDNTFGNTEVPAGGVAVIYDSVGLDNQPERFTDAWGAGTTLISVNILPALNNSGGDRIGLWSSHASYGTSSDTPLMEPLWGNAVFELDYTSDAMSPNPFPGVGGGGPSIAYGGSGDIHLGSNWVASVHGERGAFTSTATTIDGASINSPDDSGTPGLILVGGTPPASSLLITEIMYNPRSDEPEFEWVEILNNTGSTINFGKMPYVFDDVASAARTEFNVTTGIVADGEIAVLYNESLTTGLGVTAQQWSDAWEPNIGSPVNFIPVASWPSLNNGGDSIGLWDNLTEYASDYAQDPTLWANAAATVIYDDDPDESWPVDDGNGSIYLNDLAADANTATSWFLTGGGDDEFGTANPQAITGTLPDHPGGDVGSPGFVAALVGVPGDYNGNGVVDAADYTVWRDHLGQAFQLSNEDPGDANPGVVDQDDYAFWKSQFGNSGSGSLAASSVPEPMSAALLAIGMSGCWFIRRRQT